LPEIITLETTGLVSHSFKSQLNNCKNTHQPAKLDLKWSEMQEHEFGGRAPPDSY